MSERQNHEQDLAARLAALGAIIDVQRQGDDAPAFWSGAAERLDALNRRQEDLQNADEKSWSDLHEELEDDVAEFDRRVRAHAGEETE
ncbi:MAG: hypothetical protein JJ899_10770 [Alphaproteobacteria bacterium]|nr:hypothetical protein [Alphaproteobacteria bacterium]